MNISDRILLKTIKRDDVEGLTQFMERGADISKFMSDDRCSNSSVIKFLKQVRDVSVLSIRDRIEKVSNINPWMKAGCQCNNEDLVIMCIALTATNFDECIDTCQSKGYDKILTWLQTGKKRWDGNKQDEKIR